MQISTEDIQTTKGGSIDYATTRDDTAHVKAWKDFISSARIKMSGNFVKGDRKFIGDTAMATSLVIATAGCIALYVTTYVYHAASTGFAANSLQHFCLVALGIASLCTLALVAKIAVEICVATRTINSLFRTPCLNAALCGAMTTIRAETANGEAAVSKTASHAQTPDFQHLATNPPVTDLANATRVHNVSMPTVELQPIDTPKQRDKGTNCAVPSTTVSQAEVTDSSTLAATRLAHPWSTGYTC